MPELSPRGLLKIFYPDPVPAGQFAFYTTTLEGQRAQPLVPLRAPGRPPGPWLPQHPPGTLRRRVAERGLGAANCPGAPPAGAAGQHPRLRGVGDRTAGVVGGDSLRRRRRSAHGSPAGPGPGPGGAPAAVDRHFDPGRGAAGATKRQRGRLRLRLLASPPPSIVSPRGSSRTTDKRPPPSATACAPSRTGPAAVVSWSSKAAPAAASPGLCTPPSHPTT